MLFAIFVLYKVVSKIIKYETYENKKIWKPNYEKCRHVEKKSYICKRDGFFMPKKPIKTPIKKPIKKPIIIKKPIKRR
jgi:hypothetical protein